MFWSIWLNSEILEIEQNGESDDNDCIADDLVKTADASEAIEIFKKVLQNAIAMVYLRA